MRLIGLTGGIGTGKSTVGRIVAAAGVPVVDADDLAHRATAVGGPAYAAVVSVFGTGIVTADGRIDRRRLGEIVFADPVARQQLNGIVHPAVRQMMREQIDSWRQAGVGVAVVIVPLLYESGLEGLFDEIWVAACPADLQRQRVQRRDGYSAAHTEARIAAQLPMAVKVARADRVIDTSVDLAGVNDQVQALLSRA